MKKTKKKSEGASGQARLAAGCQSCAHRMDDDGPFRGYKCALGSPLPTLLGFAGCRRYVANAANQLCSEAE